MTDRARQLACAAPRCAIPGRHTDTCAGGQCRGCLAAQALDGLRLCGHDLVRLEHDAHAAASLYDELGQRLAASDRPGERVRGGGSSTGTALNDRAVDARSDIRATLASWCQLVSEERGIGLPDDNVTAMGDYLAEHATWLAAHPAAGDCADELRELAHGAPYRVAYPTGARVFIVAPCPLHPNGVACPGQLKAVVRQVDALLPSELVCSEDPEHRWDSTQWIRLGRQIERERAA